MHRTLPLRVIYTGLALCALLAFSACQTTALRDYSSRGVYGASGGKQDFTALVRTGYSQLAEYEEALDMDPESAAHFKAKAGQVHTSTLPDNPSEMQLSMRTRSELDSARSYLVDALQNMRSKQNDAKLAEALVNYDCWLERAEDRTITSLDHKEDFCHERFTQALARLNVQKANLDAVYFGSNTAILEKSELKKLEAVAAQVPEGSLWRVHLTGHTDGKGSYDENVVLSMRRAVAVRNALLQYGVDRDRIVIEAVGETGSLAGEDDSTARRVEIYALPVYVQHKVKGPDIHKIMPHYFSNEADM